ESHVLVTELSEEPGGGLDVRHHERDDAGRQPGSSLSRLLHESVLYASDPRPSCTTSVPCGVIRFLDDIAKNAWALAVCRPIRRGKDRWERDPPQAELG